MGLRVKDIATTGVYIMRHGLVTATIIDEVDEKRLLTDSRTRMQDGGGYVKMGASRMDSGCVNHWSSVGDTIAATVRGTRRAGEEAHSRPRHSRKDDGETAARAKVDEQHQVRGQSGEYCVEMSTNSLKIEEDVAANMHGVSLQEALQKGAGSKRVTV